MHLRRAQRARACIGPAQVRLVRRSFLLGAKPLSKMVIVADVHVHPYRICSNDNGQDRLRDGLSVLEQSLDLARQHDALWVMAGDFKMPKTNWPQEALTGALEIIRRADNVEKVMIAGNHDAYGIGGSGLQPFRDGSTIIVEREAEQIGDILYVPYGADLTLVKANKHLPIVSHAFLKGAFIGPEDMRLPGKGVDLAEYGQFPVAFFGDIHKAQMRLPADPKIGRIARWEPITRGPVVRQGGPWRGEVYYPGSPYQQNWGERNDLMKGALLADTREGTVEFKPLDAPRFMHVELEDCEALPEILTQAGMEKNFVRIIADSATWTAKAIEAKGLNYRWLQIVERPRERKDTKRTVLHAGMSKREMLKAYMSAKPIPPGTDPEQVLKAGVYAIGEEV